MNTNQFSGFLSSTTNPGQLSLTVASLTKTILSLAALWAVAKGLDTQAVTSQVQSVIDTVATGVTAGLVVYHSFMTAYGLVHKLIYKVAATPPSAVNTVEVMTPAELSAS